MLLEMNARELFSGVFNVLFCFFTALSKCIRQYARSKTSVTFRLSLKSSSITVGTSVVERPSMQACSSLRRLSMVAWLA